MTNVPIIKIEEALIVSLHGHITDQQFQKMQEHLAKTLGRTGAKAIIFDASNLPYIDAYIADVFNQVIQNARVYNTPVLLCGIQPAVALIMAEMHISPGNVRTFFTLDDALAFLKNGASSG